MNNYKLTNFNSVIRLKDNATIPIDYKNSDYRDYLSWLDEGNIPDPTDPPPEPEPRLVLKRLIIDRLHETGKLKEAFAALHSASLYDQQRWLTRDSIYYNDPTMLAMLNAIGADPEIIMAPDV